MATKKLLEVLLQPDEIEEISTWLEVDEQIEVAGLASFAAPPLSRSTATCHRWKCSRPWWYSLAERGHTDARTPPPAHAGPPARPDQDVQSLPQPRGTDADITRLRELHAAMDRAILACYGWVELDPAHGFHQNERGQTRYTISPTARREVLHKLLELNLEIAAGETKTGARRRGGSSSAQ